MSKVKPTVAQLVIDSLRDVLVTHHFRWFREGDPIIIPQSRLPALLVTEDNTDYDYGATGMIDVTHNLRVQVVLNKKTDFGNTKESSSLDKVLDRIMQGRDADTGALLPDTIMGAFLKNRNFLTYQLSGLGTPTKGIIARSETLITAEAHVTLSLVETIPKPPRD